MVPPRNAALGELCRESVFEEYHDFIVSPEGFGNLERTEARVSF
jgi:hypothetical protein